MSSRRIYPRFGATCRASLDYTVRKEKYRTVTLENIAKKCNGWQPHDAHYNQTEGSAGTSVKGAYLREIIFSKYGMSDQRKYYGIESGSGVRAMLRSDIRCQLLL
ncbi:MAG: hypothetical protein OXG68_19515 [Chloroflexi bacterium]|nr:hypothetical protein [Chloroflexota bacterium]